MNLLSLRVEIYVGIRTGFVRFCYSGLDKYIDLQMKEIDFIHFECTIQNEIPFELIVDCRNGEWKKRTHPHFDAFVCVLIRWLQEQLE